MKILLANKFFFQKGGAETVFFQERKFLLTNGHSVVDFSMVHPNNLTSLYAKYFIPNVEYRDKSNTNLLKKLQNSLRIASSFVHNRRAVQNLKKLIDKEKPEIAHLHNIYHQITPSIIPVLSQAGVKVVLTLHDYKIICPNYLMLSRGRICQKCEGKKFWHSGWNRCEQDSFAGSLLLAIEAYWHKFFKSYEYVDLFIAPSSFMADMVSRFRIRREKIRILHNGIDTRQFTVTGNDDGYALYFGRISREKGVETFLNAHSRLDKRISAKIVGTGPLMDPLKKRFTAVDFMGFRQGQELRQIIQNASFVVVPSEWYENCSMVVLEAMALGKPVIGAKVGGIPEQIEDGKTGFLFEMGNEKELAEKMTILSENHGLRMSMAKAARTKLENEYSLRQHYEGLLKIYQELL